MNKYQSKKYTLDLNANITMKHKYTIDKKPVYSEQTNQSTSAYNKVLIKH